VKRHGWPQFHNQRETIWGDDPTLGQPFHQFAVFTDSRERLDGEVLDEARKIDLADTNLNGRPRQVSLNLYGRATGRHEDWQERSDDVSEAANRDSLGPAFLQVGHRYFLAIGGGSSTYTSQYATGLVLTVPFFTILIVIVLS